MRRATRSGLLLIGLSGGLLGTLATTANAVTFTVSVDGADAIFLAGRTDVAIPPANQPWDGPGTHLTRHGGPTPEEALEQVPEFVPVAGGDVLRVLDPVAGGINFFNGFARRSSVPKATRSRAAT